MTAERMGFVKFLKNSSLGHVLAIVTVVIWGTTFVSTKVLLNDGLQPLELTIYRFAIGYAVLWLLHRKQHRPVSLRWELMAAAAGLCGVTGYFILENAALALSPAANVSIVVSAAPIFTALFAFWVLGSGEKPGWRFFAGFVLALGGIALVATNGSAALALNPAGDLMALACAALWGVYAVLTQLLLKSGENVLFVTRRIFFYGLLWAIPAVLLFDTHFNWTVLLSRPTIWLNVIYLGLFASALSYVTWHKATHLLGAVSTNVYIYIIPVVTLLTGAVVLGEAITLGALCGLCCIVLGLVLSEKRKR